MEIVRTVGSGLNNKFVINKPGIADRHAEITYGSGYSMMVEDLDSHTGTFVNNRRIKGRKMLKPGDILCFGDVVFPFEEHYPEMLKTQSTIAELDSGPDDGEPHDVLTENDAKQEETLAGLSGVKRFIYALQFPKDRQRMQRFWMLVMGGVILMSLVLPWLSWSNPSWATFLVDDKYDPISGISMIMDLFEVELSGAPMLYILLYGITILIFFGTVSAMICYLLVGLNVWKPRNLLAIRRLSQTVLILFGVNFLLQFMRYVWYWLDGENAVVVTRNLSTSGISEARVYIEYIGIGYWICGFAILLALRSTRNGLWRPNFSRKWASLSFSFWLPIVMLLVLAHQSAGLFQREMDKDAEDDKSTMTMSRLFDEKEMKERVTINGPGMANAAYLYLIREWKRDEDKQNRLRNRTLIDDERTKRKTYMTGIWLMLHGILIVSVVQLFRKRIRGTTTLILASTQVVLAAGLYFFMYQLVDMIPDSAQGVMQFSVSYACYLAIFVALGMLGEQFYFWTTRNEKMVTRETGDMIDDLT